MKEDSLFSAIRETFKHGLIYGAGQILSRAIGFLLIPLYTNYLSPSEFGILSLLTITASIAQMLFSMGLNSALFRSYFDYEDDKNRAKVISTVFYITILSSTLLSFLGYFLSPYLINVILESNKFINYLRFVFFIASFKLIGQFTYSVYRVKILSKRYTLFSILFFTLRLILTILLVAVFKKGVWGVIIADFIISVLSSVILLCSIKEYIIRFFVKYEAIKTLSFGLPLVPQNLSGFVLASAASYFLKYFSTIATVGVYNIGYRLGMIFHVLLVFPLAMIWNPIMLSIKDKEYCDQYYSKALTYFVFIGFFIASLLSILSKDILHLIAKEPFWEAYRVVPFIAYSYLLLGVARILDVGIPIKRKTHYSAFAFIIAALLNLLLNWVLIPKYQMIGAALATFLSYFIVVGVEYPLNRILYKLSYEWRRISKIIFVGCFLYFLGNKVETGNTWSNIILKLIIILLYPAILMPLKFYEYKEKKKIIKIYKSLIRKLKSS